MWWYIGCSGYGLNSSSLCRIQLKWALVGKYTNTEDDGHEKIEIVNPYTDVPENGLQITGKAKLDNTGFIHPDHDLSERTYDIMLMKLEHAASSIHAHTLMKINMDPAVPIKEDEGMNEITIIGMGNTDNGGELPKPDTLQQVHVNYLPFEECIDSEGYTLDYKYELLPHMICTQGTGTYSNRGQCYGDSGGPYIVLGSTPDEDVQVGVVSWAVNCASSVFPMVGSRTSASVGFLRDVTCAISVDPPDYLCATMIMAYNNNIQTRVDVQNGVSVSVRIYSDPYGHELSWKIIDQSDTSVVYANAPYGQIVGDHTFQTIKVPSGSDLRFEINDAADDGIFGHPDAILYELVLVDQGEELILVSGNGKFTTSRTENFHVPAQSEYQAVFASRYSSFEEASLDRTGGTNNPTVPMFIFLEFGDYHEDLSWKVTSLDGNTVASKGPNEYRYGTSITEQVNLESGTSYVFTISDRRGTDDLRAIKSYKISYQEQGGLYNSGASSTTVVCESEGSVNLVEDRSCEFTTAAAGGVGGGNIDIVIGTNTVSNTVSNTNVCKTGSRYCTEHSECCSGNCFGSRCTEDLSHTGTRIAVKATNKERNVDRMSSACGAGGSSRTGPCA